MDPLRQAFAPLYGRFRSMTPGSRLLALLLAAAALAGLGYFAAHPNARPDVDLMHGVPVAKSRLPRMIAAFGKAKLTDYELRGDSIFVPGDRQATYMEALRAADALPRGLGEALPRALNDGNIFDFGTSHEQERINIAKQTAVADAIRSRPGIEDASVIYDETKTRGFQPKLSKAVVYVWPQGSSELDEATVIDIRNDVVGAYAELKPENVTVSDLNGHTWRGSVGRADEIAYRALISSRRPPPRAKLPQAPATAALPVAPAADFAVDWSAWGQKAAQWALQWWKHLAGAGATMLFLFVLRRLIASRAAEAEPAASIASAPPAGELPQKKAPPPPHWRRDAAVDRPLREELSQLVEADPEVAANILRNWIGQTS